MPELTDIEKKAKANLDRQAKINQVYRDFDELKSGKRREATYNGILAFMARLSIVFSGITLSLVQLSTGFVSGAETQPPTAEFGLKLLVSIIPFLGGLLALLIFKFFPINYKKFCDMQEQLKTLHIKRLEELEKIK